MFSSVGRASRLHREGQEFESLNIHQNKKPSVGWFYYLTVTFFNIKLNDRTVRILLFYNKTYHHKQKPATGRDFYYLRRPNFLISSSYSVVLFFLMYANNFLRRFTINNRPRRECLSL